MGATLVGGYSSFLPTSCLEKHARRLPQTRKVEVLCLDPRHNCFTTPLGPKKSYPQPIASLLSTKQFSRLIGIQNKIKGRLTAMHR